ncbi:hypothetical protein HHI36_003218 [Cryptolaemus montrouzieri]|uniref:Uncharacterized protein n=1 Tax=Cryptolaemus montrouzieri TaxID=559131 RepID=A0ABD2PCT5_9CUCU
MWPEGALINKLFQKTGSVKDPNTDKSSTHKVNKLSLLHLNIQDLLEKHNRLEGFLISECMPDILCISEHFVYAAMCREITLYCHHTATIYGRPNLQQGGVDVF